MFEINECHIGMLTDADLRTLVARLAIAELRGQGCPISAVTAGGDQDAPDGGVDVRVDVPVEPQVADFVPRRQTGFQVKKPDMGPAAIAKEMRPKGALRPVIAELAKAGGAYVIVSAKGSVADGALTARKQAMRAAVARAENADALHLDFYDRVRLATWVNEHPGVVAWLRDRVGQPLAGWRSIGDWTDTGVVEETAYFMGDKTCLIDERSKEREKLPMAEGIARLRRALRESGQCLRLIGLSGLGKTRLVQALFESSVGEAPLDPGLAVYTDYSEETDPTARDMARALVADGRRAILIVDNCNPATHAELARICSASGSPVSLITVEYDVRDDEPERTEVFRLEATSPELVASWLKPTFPGVSQVDRERIAEFSDGNFRVARALAETLGKGDSLGQLKNRDLFARIFDQRNTPNAGLLEAAEDLALLYSYDGEDTTPDGELSAIARLSSTTPAKLFAATAELRRRGIVQSRGRWRAILPHAIANPLATYALERIPPSDFDAFCAALSPRMLKSLSRRLGYLHDSAEAKAAVARWLKPDGPLGDLLAVGQQAMDILANIAPVAPETVLAKLEAELDGPNGAAIVAPDMPQRGQWIGLVKALAYEPHMFESAAMLLARFLVGEKQSQNYNTAETAFTELFHLYLSGTRAPPAQRRDVALRLATSGDAGLRRCGAIALGALLEASRFTSTSTFDFGARPRDWGWHPAIYKDVWDWHDAAIALAVELAPVMPEARGILGRELRDLWHHGACHGAIEAAATELLKTGPWIEGWLGLRAAYKYDSKGMLAKVRKRLEKLIDRLKPVDLVDQARAAILSRMNGGYDIVDGEADDGDAMHGWNKVAAYARDIGKAMATEPEVRRVFVLEVLAEHNAPRAAEFGQGLADGTEDLAALWQELVALVRPIAANERDTTVLGGFLYQANIRDPNFCGPVLDAVVSDPDMSRHLPYFQARVALDATGLARLRRAIGLGTIEAINFHAIANGLIGTAPAGDVADLLEDIAGLESGVERALDILHMYFYREREEKREHDPRLVAKGRELLARADFTKQGMLRDYGLKGVIRISLAGDAGRDTARTVCRSIRGALDKVRISSQDLQHVLKGLFQVHPDIALDEFLLPTPLPRNRFVLERAYGLEGPIASLDSEILATWADRDPGVRYPLIGGGLNLFLGGHDEDAGELSPVFLALLDRAPEKRAFLGNFWDRLHPHGWSGSLADVLLRRRARIKSLEDHPSAVVRQWVADMDGEFDRWIESERSRDRQHEESFE